MLLNSYQLGAANRVLNRILTKQLDYTPSYYGITTIGGITLHKVKTQPYKDINIAYKLNKKLIEEFQKRYPNLRPKHQCSWSPTHHVSTDHGVLSMIKLPEAKREIFMIDAHDDANFMWEKQGRVFTTSESGNLMWKDQAIIFTTSKSGNPHGTWLGSYLIQPGNYEHQTQIYYMNTRDLSDTEKETLATLIKMNIVTMGSGCVDIGISECTDINQFIDAQKDSGNVRVICGKDNKPWRICSANSVGE